MFVRMLDKHWINRDLPPFLPPFFHKWWQDFFRPIRLKCFIQDFRQPAFPAGKDVGINRGCNYNGSVPQLAAHHFKVCPVFKECRGVGMPEGMEAAVAQGLFTPPVEVADTVRGEGAAVSVAADEG